jgi:hypothetical protein
MFSAKSLYNKMQQGGATVAHVKDIWKIAAPLNVCIFLWQLANDRLPAAQQIKKRHGPSHGNCVLCIRPEDVSHIFFTYPLAQFQWSAVRSMLNISWNPSCFADIFAIFLRFIGRTRKLH